MGNGVGGGEGPLLLFPFRLFTLHPSTKAMAVGPRLRFDGMNAIYSKLGGPWMGSLQTRRASPDRGPVFMEN